MPLKDIHNGIGGKPLLTAIPRVGPVLTTELKYTNDDFSSNEQIAERLVEVEERRKYASPSILTRIMNPKKVSEWSKKIEEEKLTKMQEDWEYRQSSGHTGRSTSSGNSRSRNSTSSSTSSDSAPTNVSSDPINGTFDIFFGN